MVSYVGISILTWIFLCFFAIMDHVSTYWDVEITSEALGKKDAEKRENNIFQKFLWKRFSYKTAAVIGLILQWIVCSIVALVVFLTKDDIVALAALVLSVMMGSFMVTGNFLYYRRCYRLKERYPKKYKRLIRDYIE
ncbi:hypothetical protein H0N98_04655 [Candidatus Micrarchaeota archaeon]|nr:hypothetical protein [Candidatus Micrarchaeota archaeon]